VSPARPVCGAGPAVAMRVCEHATERAEAASLREGEVPRRGRKRNRNRERELRRKEAAPAEPAALLTLRKKTAAIWGGRARTHDQHPGSPGTGTSPVGTLDIASHRSPAALPVVGGSDFSANSTRAILSLVIVVFLRRW
jgi:hypothetical protein